MSQVGRIPKDFWGATGMDVLPLFGDPQGVNSNDKSVDIELVPQRGYFKREHGRMPLHGNLGSRSQRLRQEYLRNREGPMFAEFSRFMQAD
jgi:hypothetical protein